MTSEDEKDQTKNAVLSTSLPRGQESADVAASILLQTVDAFCHQLNNRVSTLVGDAVIIRHEVEHIAGGPSARLSRCSERIEKTAQSLVYWQERLRNTLGRHPGVLRPVDVHEVIADVRLHGSGLMSNRIRVKLTAEKIAVLGDRELLWHLFENLIRNGLEALGGRDDVEVEVTTSVDSARRMAVVVIRDNGSGIAPNDLPRIFDLNYSTKSRGLGVGLYIVRRAVDLHRGHLDCLSEQGKGTTFTVSLPLHLTALPISQ